MNLENAGCVGRRGGGGGSSQFVSGLWYLFTIIVTVCLVLQEELSAKRKATRTLESKNDKLLVSYSVWLFCVLL